MLGVGFDDGFSHGHGKYDFSLPERLHGSGEKDWESSLPERVARLTLPLTLPPLRIQVGNHYDMDAISRATRSTQNTLTLCT